MTRVLFAVSGKDYWTLADGTRHPCGYWPEELAVPYEVFTLAGWEITIATPGAVVPTADEAGFSAAMNGGSQEPGPRFRGYLDSIAGELNAPADLDGADPAYYDIVFVPGGHGPMEDLAVCTGFGGLVTGFTNAEETQVGFADKAKWLLEDRLKSAGGLFEGSGVPWAPHVVNDGNLYTGQNPASSEPLARRLVQVLG